MCQEAILNETMIYSIGELRAVMPGGIVFTPDYCAARADDDVCLCGVDFEATARANGMTVQEPDWQDRWAWEFAPARAALNPTGEA